MTSHPQYRIEGWIGEGRATAAAVATFLGKHAGTPVDVIVNSGGGAAAEGAAIKAELEQHGAVTTRIRGVAASAASLVAMGGKDILIHPDAEFMIHNPMGLTYGPADAHRKTAGILDKIGSTYAESYARATGHPVAQVAGWMAEETWLTPEEAVALNFADAIEETEGAEPVAVAAFDYTRFHHAPEHLVRLARENGWTAAPSKSRRKGKG